MDANTFGLSKKTNIVLGAMAFLANTKQPNMVCVCITVLAGLAVLVQGAIDWRAAGKINVTTENAADTDKSVLSS